MESPSLLTTLEYKGKNYVIFKNIHQKSCFTLKRSFMYQTPTFFPPRTANEQEKHIPFKCTFFFFTVSLLTFEPLSPFTPCSPSSPGSPFGKNISNRQITSLNTNGNGIPTTNKETSLFETLTGGPCCPICPLSPGRPM